MTDKLNNGIFLRETTYVETPHISPKLPEKYRHLEQYQYGGMGFATVGYNHYAEILYRDCPICKNNMHSGKWDFFGKDTRVFCCKDCELVYHLKKNILGKSILRIWAHDKYIKIK